MYKTKAHRATEGHPKAQNQIQIQQLSPIVRNQ